MEVKRTAKEIVYDDQIAPLLTEVLKLCVQHGISMSMAFDISGPEDPNLMVSSQMADSEGQWSPLLEKLGMFLKGDLEENATPDRPNPGSIGEEARKEIQSWK